MSWIKTDDTQWLKELTDGEFEVVNAYETGDNSWLLVTHIIDVEKEFNDDGLKDILNWYGYENASHVYDIYGDSYKQIIAEFISESAVSDGDSESFPHLNNLNNHLSNLGIEDGINNTKN